MNNYDGTYTNYKHLHYECTETVYRLVQKKGLFCLEPAWRGRLWLAAAGQKLSLNLAPFLLLNPVLSLTGHMMQNVLAFRDSPIIPLRRSPIDL